LANTPKGKQGHRSSEDRRESPAWLSPLVLLLLLLAFVSNLYLAYLYVRVHQTPGGSVDSFCNLTERVNCANVSATRYASFLGVPVAVYGAEFYGLTALLVLLSSTRRWSLRAWESLLFWAMVAALPVSAVMAYISAFVIRMLCPLCSVIYGVNVAVLLLLLSIRRGSLYELLRAGPAEVSGALSKPAFRTPVVLLFVAGVSQLFWIPPLLGQPSPVAQADHTQPTDERFPGGGRIVGSPAAPVELVEFSDFQCSICSHAHEIIVEVLKRAGNKVYFRHYDYPLDMSCHRKVTRPFHTDACRAAYYARCADQQKRFWPFAAQLFANQHNLSKSDLKRYATAVGLDLEPLQRCVTAEATRNAVLEEIEEGLRRGVNGTPTFFINGEKIVGPRDVQFWLNKIDSLTGGSTSSPAR
jgi:protein-disulfide isomerase/uncharacterized membrane protein